MPSSPALHAILLAAATAAAADAAPVSLELYYGPSCPHCMFFLSQWMPKLMDAHLPGDKVQVTMLPYTLDSGGTMPDAVTCQSSDTEPCHFVLPALCALEGVPMPAPIDSPELYQAYQFALCDLAHANTNSPVPQTEQTIQACASQSRTASPRFESCRTAAAPDGPAIDKMKSVYNRLSQLPAAIAPFVFINDQLLVCESPTSCSSLRSKDGEKQLKKPGDLLAAVCSQLSGDTPQACAQFQQKYDVQEDLSAFGAQRPLLLRLPSSGAVALWVAAAALVAAAIAATRAVASPARRAAAPRRPPRPAGGDGAACVREEAPLAEGAVAASSSEEARALLEAVRV